MKEKDEPKSNVWNVFKIDTSSFSIIRFRKLGTFNCKSPIAAAARAKKTFGEHNILVTNRATMPSQKRVYSFAFSITNEIFESKAAA